jgi:sugar-specific transcriptional regulator TrmB
MLKRIIKLLQQANLRDEEISIYLHLFKLQAATVSELVSKSGLYTMQVHRMLKRLAGRELVGIRSVNNKQNIYYPLSLRALVRKISIEQKKLFKLMHALKGLDRFLPYIDLKNHQEDWNKPENIEIRDGVEAMKEEYLKFPGLCKEEYLHIGSMHNLWKTTGMDYDSPEERSFIHQRLDKGVFARVLNKNEKDAQVFYTRDSLEKRSTKIKVDLPVLDNYLAIAEDQASLFVCNQNNPRVIVFRQPDLVNMYKDNFRMIWERDR